MNNKIEELIDALRVIEEKACRIGFDSEDARHHTSLIKDLKAECDSSSLDCIELVKVLPLAKVDLTSILLNC